MPFFQNVFQNEFRGNWVLGDRQHVPEFLCPNNAGRVEQTVYAWNSGPYNLSGNDLEGDSKANLTIKFAIRNNLKNWFSMTINIATGAASASAVTVDEIVANLNNNASFAEKFTAAFKAVDHNMNHRRLTITSKKPLEELKFYIVNGTAESVLRFNARAGIAQLPTYFSRHSVDNGYNYPDAQNMLVKLDVSNLVDAEVITNAVDAKGISLGYTASEDEDWYLLRGKSGLFQFQTGPGTVVDTTETSIIYPAGARVGDLAMKIIEQKDSSSLIVARWEIPYTLEVADLVSPP